MYINHKNNMPKPCVSDTCTTHIHSCDIPKYIVLAYLAVHECIISVTKFKSWVSSESLVLLQKLKCSRHPPSTLGEDHNWLTFPFRVLRNHISILGVPHHQKSVHGPPGYFTTTTMMSYRRFNLPSVHAAPERLILKFKHNLYMLINGLQPQNAFLRDYKKVRNELLIEIIKHEAPPANRTCTVCNSTPGTHRCKDCFGSHFLCDVCCVSTHLTSPFHRIQRFNGRYFEKSDLDRLGLVLDLRQHPGECVIDCQNTEEQLDSDSDISEYDDDDSDPIVTSQSTDQPQGRFTDDRRSDRRSDRRRSNLIIVSSTGIFKRSVRWCRCTKPLEPYIQLLRAKLFPASFIHPGTAFTFEVLDHFHIDALECKTAAMNFMSKIVRISNEAFPGTVPVHHSILSAIIYIS